MSQSLEEQKRGCIGCSAVLAVVFTGAGFFVLGPWALAIPVAFAGLTWLGINSLERDAALKAATKKKPRGNRLQPRPAGRLHSSEGYQEPHWRLGESADSIPVTPDDLSEPDFNAGRVIRSGTDARSFTYVDANGVVTERTISPWKEYRRHVRGWCFSAGAERTFLKDRIEGGF